MSTDPAEPMTQPAPAPEASKAEEPLPHPAASAHPEPIGTPKSRTLVAPCAHHTRTHTHGTPVNSHDNSLLL